MKKALHVCLLASAFSTFNTTQAFEMPAMPEGLMIDHISDSINKYYKLCKREGIATFNVFGTSEDPSWVANWVLQLAMPLYSRPRTLSRFEISIDHTLSAAAQMGVTGRHIATPDWIWGGYLFGRNLTVSKNYESQKTWMCNAGGELIWRPYAVMFTLDGVFSPTNPFDGSSVNSSYQYTLRASQIKLKNLELFLSGSLSKYIGREKSWIFTFLGAQKTILFKKAPNVPVVVNVELNYAPRSPVIWSRKNIGYTISVRAQLSEHKLNKSVRDYLQMPIDRAAIKPFHPNQPPHFAAIINESGSDTDSALGAQSPFSMTDNRDFFGGPLEELPPTPIEEDRSPCGWN